MEATKRHVRAGRALSVRRVLVVESADGHAVDGNLEGKAGGGGVHGDQQPQRLAADDCLLSGGAAAAEERGVRVRVVADVCGARLDSKLVSAPCVRARPDSLVTTFPRITSG